MRSILRNGFTLIELLVAVAILGILATLVIIDFSHSRMISRDSTRKQDVAGLVSAIKLYGLSHSSYFIESSDTTKGGCNITDSNPANDVSDGGCVGANGRSFGRVNFTGTDTSSSSISYTYHNSIASVLIKDGYLSGPALDPFHTANANWDYTLLRCEKDWHQSYDKTDSFFAVWAILETPQGDTERDATNRSCGGSVTAKFVPTTYDFATTVNPASDLASTKRSLAAICYAETATVFVSGGATVSGSGATQVPCGSASPVTAAPCTVVADIVNLYGIPTPPSSTPPPSTTPTSTPTSTPTPTPTPSGSSTPTPSCGSGGTPTPTPTSTPTPTATATTATGTLPVPSVGVSEGPQTLAPVADKALSADTNPYIVPDLVPGMGEKYAQGVGSL